MIVIRFIKEIGILKKEIGAVCIVRSAPPGPEFDGLATGALATAF